MKRIKLVSVLLLVAVLMPYAAVSADTDCVGNMAPEITVRGDNPTYILQGELYSDRWATAYDQEDGDLTIWIDGFSNMLYPYEIGKSQWVMYRVSDSCGVRAQVYRTVIVLPNPEFGPVIYLPLVAR